jgi:hypothetical protein
MTSGEPMRNDEREKKSKYLSKRKRKEINSEATSSVLTVELSPGRYSFVQVRASPTA